MKRRQLRHGAERALLAAVKAAAGTADVVRRPARGVVVLLYHRVGGRSGASIDLPATLFDEQMAALADAGGVLALHDALAALGAGHAEPSVVVTFDDGTADFVDGALPILVRHRIPATAYIATAFVDEQRPFPGGARPASWAGLRDACSTGLVSIGSHTHRHLLLDRVSDVEVADELDRSIGAVMDNLGRAPLDFAYPKGLVGSGTAEAAVRARFRSAALAGTRANVVGQTDIYRLARSPIQVDDGLRWFRHKVAGGMTLEDSMRRVLNRRRYARAST